MKNKLDSLFFARLFVPERHKVALMADRNLIFRSPVRREKRSGMEISMEKKCNVLIVHNLYQLAGGEDTVAENEEKLLRENGHGVYTYIRDNSDIAKMNPLQKLMTGFGMFYSFKSYREISRIIKEKDIKIVHVHNIVPLVSYSVYYAAKRNGCRLVQSIHNMRMLCPNGMMIRGDQVCEDCANKGLMCAVKHKCYRDSRIQTMVLSAAMAFHRKKGTYNLVDAYLVTTQFNYDMIRKVVSEDKIVYKPYYSDSDSFDISEKRREHYIYIARVEYMKGIFVALDAFEKMPDKKLLVMGVGPAEEEAHQIVQSKKMDNVIFVGFKPKEEMLQLLYHAKALLYPTQWYEGFPMTIVESFAVGTPIIGSNIGNVGNIIKEGKNGMTFQYNDPDDMIRAIQEFEASPEKISEMEQGAQKEFLENHTFHRVYERTDEIYSMLLERDK